MRIDNLSELHIYCEAMDRWHADFVLRTVPPGLPNVIGSPVKHPCRSREEAWRFARSLVLGLRDTTPAEAPAEDGDIPFDFDEVTLNVPRAFYQAVSNAGPPAEVLTDDYLQDITGRVRLAAGGTLTVERFDALDAKGKSLVMTAAVFAILKGAVRWPPYVYDEATDWQNSALLDKNTKK